MNMASTIIEALATIVIAITLVIYLKQLFVMRDQLTAMRSGAQAQNFLSLVQYLQAPDVREAREVVIRLLQNKAFKDWDEQDCRHASAVCSTYDVTGIIIRLGLVAPKPIVENWGPSIKQCFEACEPLIKERRRTAGPTYWDDFDWLYSQVK